jgi:hypothetical protein
VIEDWAPVQEWHRVVNDKDIDAARAAVAEDVAIGGPKGEGTGVDVFIDWVEHAGIHLTPVSWHPVDDETIVVEQDATWPHNPHADPGADPGRVATLFRLQGDRVAAALRFDDLHQALVAATG